MNRILGMSATAVLLAAVAVRAGVAATVTGAASTRSYGGTAAPAPVVIQATGGENLRIIRGEFDGIGNIDAGSGFTVSHPFIGEYVITFTTPFSGIPSVTGTGINIDGTAFFVQDFNVTANAVTITLVHNSDSNPVNGPFDFMAVGPR